MNDPADYAVPAAAVAITVYLLNVLKLIHGLHPAAPPLLAIVFGFAGLTAVSMAAGEPWSLSIAARSFIGAFLVAQAASGVYESSKRDKKAPERSRRDDPPQRPVEGGRAPFNDPTVRDEGHGRG